MAIEQPQQQHEQQIDVTAAEWLMIIVTGFTGIFAGPFAIIPGAVVVGMFTYRLNPELMKATKAGQWVRGLLPAPTPDSHDARQTVNTSQKAAQQATGATAAQATQTKGKAAKALPVVELEQIAQATTILLVGSRGSGKSTLLRAILATKAAMKESTIAVYDPHAAPGDWPMATMVHNSEDEISKAMAGAYKRLQARKDERRKGIRLKDWPRLTLAADEWGSIVANVELPEAIKKTPGEVSTELMKEGRKFDMGFVAGAHGLTNKSLGCVGDQEAFLNSFDWIIHMGAFTRKQLPPIYIERWDEMPMGTNEQGGKFPLCVACQHVSGGEIHLLDMRGLAEIVDTQPIQVASIIPPQRKQTGPDQALLVDMLGGYQADNVLSMGDNELQPVLSAFQASQRAVAQSLSVAETTVSPAEIARITVQLQQGKAIATIVKGLPGYNSRNYQEYKRKVDYCKELIDQAEANDESNDA